MSGYFTPGMSTVKGNELSGDSRTPVDTALPNGESPQSGGIIPGTLPCPDGNIGVTAFAGGGQTDATQLDYGAATVTVVATDDDSVKLPYAYPGAVCAIWNADSAQDTTVYGRGTDTINSVATATGVSQGEGTKALYIGVAGTGDGTDAGNWMRILSA